MLRSLPRCRLVLWLFLSRMLDSSSHRARSRLALGPRLHFIALLLSIAPLAARADPSNAIVSGHGKCQGGHCVCRDGWTGKACDSIDACAGGCGGPTRGVCEPAEALGAAGLFSTGLFAPSSSLAVSVRTCRCHLGFSGADCSVLTCNDGRGCGAHGACDKQTGQCVCTPGWSGVECNVQLCPRECSHHGTCIEGVCKCNAGRVGEACEARDCSDPLCGGHGACVQGVCVCDGGFTGKSCEIRGCAGAPPCRGVGKCVAQLAALSTPTDDGTASMGALTPTMLAPSTVVNGVARQRAPLSDFRSCGRVALRQEQ